MTNTWYVSDWDQACCPSYAKICHTVVRHIQVHLYKLQVNVYVIHAIYCFRHMIDSIRYLKQCMRLSQTWDTLVSGMGQSMAQ